MGHPYATPSLARLSPHMPISCLTHLECSYCAETFDAETVYRTCPACGKVLFARYDLTRVRDALTKDMLLGRQANMWRYRELMPVRDPANIISLGEGFTPILDAARLAGEVGLRQLLIKDEGVNPTGSFKARGLSAAVSKAKELGQMKLAMPSAGNAAGAMSAYAAQTFPASVMKPATSSSWAPYARHSI